MGFVPYKCLHVPVHGAGVAGGLVKAWPAWIIAAGFLLALREWGLWLFIVPAACTVAVILAVRFARAGMPPPPAPAPGRAEVEVRVTLGPLPVTTGAAGRCLRCGTARASTVLTVRGTPIPVCEPCVPYTLTRIQEAAALEARR